MNSVPFGSDGLSVLRSELRTRLLRFQHELGVEDVVAASCPVCRHVEAARLQYPAFDTENVRIPTHDKYECRSCGHIFTRWLPDDVDDLGELYSKAYDTDETPEPNPRKSAERELLDRAMEEQGKEHRILDFSCGNNYSIVTEARSDGHQVFGCDIRDSFPAEREGLFYYHPEMSVPHEFDGIVSVDALEHVQDIESTWRFLNRALVEGGVMLHSFPTAFRFHRGHHFLQIPFHACLFSRESLSRWSERMGFAYRGERELLDSDVGYYYAFEKVNPV